MIEVQARWRKKEMQINAGMPDYVEVDSGEETRYLDPSDNIRIQPSNRDGWGSYIKFPDGSGWTVRQDPSTLAEEMEATRGSEVI